MTDRPLLNAPDLTPPDAVADLRDRLARRRFVPDPWSGDPEKGFGPSELDALLGRWGNGYDWAGAERDIRALPWQVVVDARLRVLHQRAEVDAPTVVLLHGWPDSVLRFARVLPLLSDINVVVPALPGFPFALAQREPASVDEIAERVGLAMETLGYPHYVVSGGDVGGDVAQVLAARYPERVIGMHLTSVSARHVFSVDPAELTADARGYIGKAMAWNRVNGGYVAEQSTRPRTVLAGLGDSPVALAAWLLEKITAWTDDATSSFSDDELLTWVSIYWFSSCIGSSFGTYVEPAAIPRRNSVPTVISAFAHDIKPAPRAWSEAFVNVRDYVEHPVGGHFAAWEHPDLYVADLRRAVLETDAAR